MLPVLGVLEVTDQELAWTGYLGRTSKVLGGVPEHGSRKLSVGRMPGKPRYPLPMNGHSPRQPAPGDRN